jgi:hypothetical protein
MGSRPSKDSGQSGLRAVRGHERERSAELNPLTDPLPLLDPPLHAPLTLHNYFSRPLTAPLPLRQFFPRSAPIFAPLTLRSNALVEGSYKLIKLPSL